MNHDPSEMPLPASGGGSGQSAGQRGMVAIEHDRGHGGHDELSGQFHARREAAGPGCGA